MTDIICSDKNYSTTRLVTKEKPEILNNLNNKFESCLFFPPSKGRVAEGGLRGKGYFKKSHSAYGFEEPLKDFTPAIGISEVTYNDNKIYVSSLRAESIYILELTKDYQITDQTRINFGSRIRDLKYDQENDIFLILLENIPAIGVLKFN